MIRTKISKRTKSEIDFLFRALKLNRIDRDFFEKEMLEAYKRANLFNFDSFGWGITVGILIYKIINFFCN